MQIKFIISNHSIRETTLCTAQTYGAASGGQSRVSVAPETGERRGWRGSRTLFVGLGDTGELCLD